MKASIEPKRFSKLTTTCCRSCGAPLATILVDLGLSPLSNSYVSYEQATRGELFLPLCAYVCDRCLLVQLESFETPDRIFSAYAYMSSFSDMWLAHARAYVDRAAERLAIDETSFVVEVASNDGYLLQYFVEKNVPVLGIEPAANVALEAEKRGVRTVVEFFGARTARALRERHGPADLMIANNVIAHVPDLHDFVEGLAVMLAASGTMTVEFPHILHLMEQNQFDTIYHEHFSYFSLFALEPVFAKHGLEVVDVDRLDTHGGSLRLWLRHAGVANEVSEAVTALRRDEAAAGLGVIETYVSYAPKVHAVKRDLLEFFFTAAREGKRVAGYGAPAKGNTLLNYCGVRADMLEFTVDRNPLKQGQLLPGTRIPIYEPERIGLERPDYVLILPWNIQDEVIEQMGDVRSWGGKFVVAIPKLAILA